EPVCPFARSRRCSTTPVFTCLGTSAWSTWLRLLNGLRPRGRGRHDHCRAQDRFAHAAAARGRRTMTEPLRFTDVDLAAARARPDKYLTSIGYPTEKRGPCPIEGAGDDRFTVRTKNGVRIWYCRGCQTGGDAIRLVELHRRCSFVEAVRLLANIPDQPAPK